MSNAHWALTVEGAHTLTRLTDPANNSDKFRRFIAIQNPNDATEKWLLTQTGRWTSATERGDWNGGTYRFIKKSSFGWEHNANLNTFLANNVNKKIGTYTIPVGSDFVTMTNPQVRLALSKAKDLPEPVLQSCAGGVVDDHDEMRTTLDQRLRDAPAKGARVRVTAVTDQEVAAEQLGMAGELISIDTGDYRFPFQVTLDSGVTRWVHNVSAFAAPTLTPGTPVPAFTEPRAPRPVGAPLDAQVNWLLRAAGDERWEQMDLLSEFAVIQAAALELELLVKHSLGDLQTGLNLIMLKES